MSEIPRYLIAALTVVMIALGYTRAGDQPLGREELASIQEATRVLAREVEFLQDVVAEQSGQKEWSLYRQADAVQANIVDLQKLLKAENSRKALYEAFDKLDRKVHEFLKDAQAPGPEQRLLRRLAARVSAADEELHYALFAKDASKDRAKQLLERQARGLSAAARQLDTTAGYALAGIQGKGVLAAELHKLAEAAEQFEKSLASGTDRPLLLKDFAKVNQAWERAVQGLGKLRAGDSMHLIRAAGQMDRLHERLFRLLGADGERPQLILRA